MARIGTEVIRALKKRLSHWAAPRKIPETDETGVEVLYNNQDGHTVLFHGVTHDDIEWQIKFDFRHISEEYIDNMFRNLKKFIETHRKERSPIIIPSNLPYMLPERLIK